MTAQPESRNTGDENIDRVNRKDRRGSQLFAYLEGGNDGPYGGPTYLNYLNTSFVTSEGNGNKKQEALEDSTVRGASSFAETYLVTQKHNNQLSHNEESSSISNLPDRLGQGEAARMLYFANAQDLPGGLNHRPLVGGFAAAAYEASKSLYYSTKGTSEEDGPIPSGKRGISPSI